MCGLCGILGGSAHWADAVPSVERGATRRRERLDRVRLVNDVLRPFALRLHDWQGSAFLLSNRTGRTEIVDDLAALWSAAARMTGRVLDPLDPALIGALESDHDR